MPTSRSSRTPPPRLFADYILTWEVGKNSGLSRVDKTLFSPIPGSVGQPDTDDAVSAVLDIGFIFKFENKNYTKYVVSTDGWIALIDPDFSTFTLTDILESGAATRNNSKIKDTFTKNHVLLAPWFDDLVNKKGNLNYILSLATRDRMEKGLAPLLPNYHPSENGVQYYLDKNSRLGKRLIIRWNSIHSQSTHILTFESVIYENGRIEFRYAPRSNWFTSPNDGKQAATCGIFLNNDQDIKHGPFRDFSPLFGYRPYDRPEYVYGGATYNAAYTDTDAIESDSVNYTVNLDPSIHWPGQNRLGATVIFQPPLNRRKILPRQTLRDRDNRLNLPVVSRTGAGYNSNSSFFDDRTSISYGIRKRTVNRQTVYLSGSNLLNYPTTIPRFYGNSQEGISDRQNLFAGDFLVTASTSKSLVQDLIGNSVQEYVTPFNESLLFANENKASQDPFFSVGTSIEDVGLGFSQPLKSKTQIRMSMRVDHKTRMFEASSSIYYFSPTTKRWQYPTSSFVGGGDDIASPYSEVYRSRLVEVDRGFNAFGFNICSGSNSAIRRFFEYGTDDIFNQGWTKENETIALNKTYSKSVQNDTRYSATNNEFFTVPISHPFLLEKAVIEIPIEAGPGWFNDKTQCFLPIANTYSGWSPFARSYPFDVGGPGVTIALFNQINIGGGRTRRDLILSGTITHEFDDVTNIVYSRAPDLGSLGGDVWQIVPQGFNAYGTPSTVVSGSNQFFTGTVRVKCEAAISNGVMVRDTIYANQTSYVDYLTGSLENIFNFPEWSLVGRGNIENFNQDPGGNGFRERTIVAVNNLGRGGTGFEPSGRSIFGKEYVTSQGLSQKSYPNVFYKYKNSSILNELKTIASTASPTPEFYATSVVNQQTSKASPYLLFPNDKLILSVSKTRPYFFSTEVSSPYTTGSIQHDIKLSTGSINITLYGSLVANGQEFHNNSSQIASDAVHEVIFGDI